MAGEYASKVTEYSRTLSLADYVRDFRDAPKFLECCRVCPGYGRSWTCPPLEFDIEALLARYSRITLLAARIEPEGKDIPIAASHEILHPVRVRLEAELRRMERETGGLALAFAGKCLYCGEKECRRVGGKKCAHPELMRHSLEALGFDVEATARDLLGLEILWGRDGMIPDYLTLVAGVMF